MTSKAIRCLHHINTECLMDGCTHRSGL
uniref:Uncharacterized protein n=1 Tax=Anguilla anguilla TaxID=7936 RepID=A0A0E9RUH9_ANGAN